MRSPHLEGIDFVYAEIDLGLDQVCECRWDNSLATSNPLEPAFPIRIRRERYHHASVVAHLHKGFYALYIVRGGRGTRVVNGQAHSMARGDIFLMAPDNVHLYGNPVDLTVDGIYFGECLWGASEWDALRELPDLEAFLAPGLGAFAARGYTDHFGHLSPEPHARIEAAVATIRGEIQSRVLPYRLAARARLYALLVQLADWRSRKTFTTRPARGAAVTEVLSFCEENFHRSLSTEQLAGMMHFSRTHFCEVFAREVGMPPAAYIRHLRLQHAQKLLLERDFPVTDVARLSGFGDATQMGRIFKKSFGVSPLEFRKKQKVTGQPI